MGGGMGLGDSNAQMASEECSAREGRGCQAACAVPTGYLNVAEVPRVARASRLCVYPSLCVENIAHNLLVHLCNAISKREAGRRA